MPRPWKADFRDDSGAWSRKLYAKYYSLNHRKEDVEKSKRWKENHREEYLRKNKIRQKKAYHSDKNKHRSMILRKKYGITPEDYERVLKEQNGVCAICKSNNHKEKRLHIDHCHKTGLFRGILCAACNTGLGHYEKKSALFAEYLTRCLR